MKHNKTLALLGADSPAAISKHLSSLEFEVVLLPADNRLQTPVSSHADMLISVIDNNIFCSKEYYEKNKEIFATVESYGYNVIASKAEISKKYPYDIAFNAIFLKNSVISKTDHTAEEIKEFAQKNKISLIKVNQGYAKCSTLILSDNALICADDGILNMAHRMNIEALKIENSEGAIELPGYGYGFIGGASGVFEKKVYFCGDIKYHPQGKEIAEFVTKFGYEIISLFDGKLCDIGGIIFLPPLL